MADNPADLRRQGNVFFMNAAVRILPQEKLSDLEHALKLYERAIQVTGATDEETASITKNIGKASWNIALIKRSPTSDYLLFYAKSLEYYTLAMQKGNTTKPSNWMKELQTSSQKCINEVLTDIRQLRNASHTAVITCYYAVIKCYIQKGTQAVGEQHYVEAIDAFIDCNQPMEELMSMIPGNLEVQHLQEELLKKCRTAEAYNLLVMGKDYYSKMMTDDHLDAECMYEAIDKFNQSITKSRETAIELEAIANSYIGQIYLKVLNHRERANEYFGKATFLAESLMLVDSNRLEWWKDLQEGLRNVNYSPSDTDGDISALVKARELDYPEYIHFALDRYPTKGKKKVIVPTIQEMHKMDRKKLTTILPRVIFAYHPDKHRGSAKDWLAICEEITKQLNKILDRARRSG